MVQKTYRPSPTALLNPCVDPIFKILFTDASDEAHQALTCFLSDILEKTVTDVVLQPNELSGESSSDKQSEFDINCKIDGKVVNIEMQGENHKSDYGKRAEYHAAHVLNHYTQKGIDWEYQRTQQSQEPCALLRISRQENRAGNLEGQQYRYSD